MKIEIIYNDITKLGDLVDCIVNAANPTLLGGSGVDGAIHRAAGPDLKKECYGLGGCKPGQAKYTRAYNLPQRYIIHTVGPIYHNCPNPEEVLSKAYRNSLALAEELGCTSIAFPSISTGVYGYPVEEASEVVAKVFSNYEGKTLQRVYMVILPRDWYTYEAYQKAFQKYRLV